MRVLISKDGDLLSYFDNFNDGDTDASLNNISLNDGLINNHSVEINRGKVKGVLRLEDIFGICKTFEKIFKNLGLHLTFETNYLQNISFTSFGDAVDINVAIISLYLFVPLLIPNTQTQVMYNEYIFKIIIQSHMFHGLQNVNYQLMVMNYMSILEALNILIVLNI